MATGDGFNCREMFCNANCRRGFVGDLSPVRFERRQALNGS
ncbi:hypothetical protein BLA3211_02621 [Burkholderia aenigmatica]|uniref:Uncharacterized protein n=1 Tax=Burkholderia aenigmatica TaxID=2015348 RepID=A0A6J5IY90_9BURK|nr:hypothetical protein BLA3211_02621 [Burkholderia aenigmatica]